MKILVVTDTTDIKSGWGRYSASVVVELRKLGHTVNILSSNLSGFNGESKLVTSSNSLGSFFRRCLQVRKLSKDCEVIHAFESWPYGVYAFFGVLGTRKKLFITAHGTYTIAPLSSPIKKFLIKIACKRAGRIFCVSRYTEKALLEKIPSAKTTVVHNGLSPLPELTDEEKTELQSKFYIETKGPVFLTVGAIKNRKGQLDSLKALALLKSKYPEFLYCIVGSTNDKRYVGKILDLAKSENIEKNIKIIDTAKSDKDLSFLYGISDVFLLNSTNESGFFEGFGIVILEAGQFGKPTVGSKNCGIEDAVKDGYNGFLANEGDPRDIADKIIRVLDGENPSYKELSQNSVLWASQFTWGRTVENYIRIYNQS